MGDAVVRQAASVIPDQMYPPGCHNMAGVTAWKDQPSKNQNHPEAAAASFDGTNHSPHQQSWGGDGERLTEPLIMLSMPLGKLRDTPSVKTAHPEKIINDRQPWSDHVTAK